LKNHITVFQQPAEPGLVALIGFDHARVDVKSF